MYTLFLARKVTAHWCRMLLKNGWLYSRDENTFQVELNSIKGMIGL